MSDARITNEQILESLVRCRGNIKAIADRLGLRRKSIYERHTRLLEAGLALPLEAYRKADPGVVTFAGNMARSGRGMPPRTEQHGSLRSEGNMKQVPDVVRLSSAAPVTGAHQGSTLRPMATMPAVKAQTVRVLPEDADKIARGRRRLAAALDQDLSDTLVLERFIADRFDQWVAEQIEAKEEPAAEAKPVKKPKSREGDR